MPQTLKPALLLLALLAPALHATNAAGQSYPGKPVRMIIPFPPGGSNDVVGRMIAFQLSERLAKQVVVDNQGGAGGIIGTEAVARASADGYTLLLISVAHAFGASMYKLAYDPINAFAPVALLGTGPVVLAVNAKLPVNSLKELIALAKEKPGTISFGSSGAGSSTHLALELFNSLAGVKITHIPYTGSPQVVTDLLGGRIQGYFSPASTVMGHVQAGKLVALAVTDARRSTFMPQLPTMTEAGVPDCISVLWFGIAAPTGTPQPIIDKISAAHKAIAADETMQKRFLAAGGRLLSSTPAEAKAFAATETKMWQEVVRLSGLTPQ
jgi:tripartite-type tricarboxylate transporter receptor subunit TctC